jgi:hypothetical protein
MGYWARLASKAAFRKGQANYCGYINEVDPGTWSGGVVGLKSILGVKSRQRVMEIMDTLVSLGYIEYSLDPNTKKLTYRINDFVLKCTGEPCLGSGAVYATDGYGFLCLPRDITLRLAESGYTFEDSDAFLDLWCHTVWQDPRNVFSSLAPVIQYGQHGAITLETLGRRWGWEKTKVWRFLQKHKDAFTLRKLPGSFGCLIFNTQYPTGEDCMVPAHAEVIRIWDGIRIRARNTHSAGQKTHSVRSNTHSGTSNTHSGEQNTHLELRKTHFDSIGNGRASQQIAGSNRAASAASRHARPPTEPAKGRVAVSAPITRAYFSQQHCRNCDYDCIRIICVNRDRTEYDAGPCRGP